MKRTVLLPFIISSLVIASVFFFFNTNHVNRNKVELNHRFERGNEHSEWLHQEYLMLRDPKTKRIPDNIRQRELKFAKTLPKHEKFSLYKGKSITNVQALSWTERGPSNIGGRTRAIGVDVNNTSIILAGGASGGIWRSTDGGTSWNIMTSPSSVPPVTCIAQDTRSGHENTWYAGTGEYTSTEFDDKGGTNKYLGNGIYKSTDNGVTWNLLSNTAVTQPESQTSSAFSYTNGIAIDPSNSAQDVVYAATNGGIQKSTDGGSTWAAVLNSSSYGNQVYYCQLAVSSTGIVYATVWNQISDIAGIWKANNPASNSDWTNITSGTFPSIYNRIVIGIAPSNENIVYFFGQTPGSGKAGLSNDYLSLWKYDASGPTWTDLSSNLPTVTGPVGGLNSQGSYNLFITVKPDDENFVVIGTTNMYRSTDGFSSSSNTTWIGGYSPANNISPYPNHHPDCHILVFQPGSSIIAYSGHDGGISKTSDITANNGGNTPITWVNLDNNYDVTQYYSLSLSPDNGDNTIAGGAQDNGNSFTTSAGFSSWTSLPYGGDGGYDIVAPSADNRIYAEYQNGGIFAADRSNNPIGEFAPPNGTYNQVNQLFINPYALDPNNSSIMYYAGGNTDGTKSGLWRNNNVNDASISAVKSAWTQLTNTVINTDQVTAIGISTAGNANVVYYGTSKGQAFRIDNANTGDPSPTTITGGSFPSLAYVSCIAVDPTNSNKAMLLFSNYNVDRIWYTTDGGSSWTNESGNLNSADGPSVRWAKIFDISGVTHYFIATSTGVYYTTALNGASTTWTQEAVNSVGNAVCSMLDYRSSDQTIGVSTHGRGIYTSVISAPLPVELVAFSGYASPGKINLIWKTQTETNNYGFEIERSSDSKEWRKIDFVEGAGNSNSPKQYTYEDKYPTGGSDFYYRLKQVDNDGKFKYSDIINIKMIPEKFTLSQNYPNPFNPATTINFSVPEKSKITLSVYNINGQKIKTLVNGIKESGAYSVKFNGANLASGVYFYRLITNGSSIIKKMLLLR